MKYIKYIYTIWTNQVLQHLPEILRIYTRTLYRIHDVKRMNIGREKQINSQQNNVPCCIHKSDSAITPLTTHTMIT
jgi:hypothetical protein